MLISELIDDLEKLRNAHGDVGVEVRNVAGDLNDAAIVLASHYGTPDKPLRWFVYIDV